MTTFASSLPSFGLLARASTFALVLAALGAAAGCSRGAHLVAPDTFAVVGGSGYDYRAASAQGVVVGVRSEPNEPKARVDFWADALDLRLRRAGYAAESATAVKSASGLVGRQIRYQREENRRSHAYWLTVFATESRVYVVEAAGDREHFDGATKDVERAVLSLRTE